MYTDRKTSAHCCLSNRRHYSGVKLDCRRGNALIKTPSSTPLYYFGQFFGRRRHSSRNLLDCHGNCLPSNTIGGIWDEKKILLSLHWLFGCFFADVATMDIFLLLTIERYLTTVFWFKWNLRMKHVLLASLISVTSCLAFSVWRLFDDELNSFRYPLSDFEHKTYRINSIGMVIIANLVYLTTIGMYSHIFIVVRHSSRQIGTAREVRLAKRIGSLVCTNFIFLFIPFSIYIFIIATGCFAGSSAEVSVAIFVGCLGILPGMNSIMNPILYGYRNDRLKKKP